MEKRLREETGQADEETGQGEETGQADEETGQAHLWQKRLDRHIFGRDWTGTSSMDHEATTALRDGAVPACSR
jgi:hypothetical protein